MPAKRKKKNIKISSDELRKKLKVKHLHAKSKLNAKYPHVEKYFKDKGVDPGKIREHSAKVLGAGILAGGIMMSPNVQLSDVPTANDIIDKLQLKHVKVDLKSSPQLLSDALEDVLPKRPRPLTQNEEKVLEQLFNQFIGVKTKANLEGEHLNTTYGYIGAEQHLRRYPGDTLSYHGSLEDQKEGIAPGLGAWGYFAPSRDKLTPELEETERWYAVVQTLYLPDWNTRTKYLREWYKYRKVLIVNTENGNAVVAAIADSGPAAWTGKQFGGSPEVMDHLGGPRYKKGAVLVFFVDDPENNVPLGPIEYGRIIPDNLVLSYE
jgi:hypothetical protein